MRRVRRPPRSPKSSGALVTGALVLGALVASAAGTFGAPRALAQPSVPRRTAALPALRLYVLDCGTLIFNHPEDYNLTREEQGQLNQVGVNCIRLFGREGIRVWGARTLADGSGEWRYLNVRRLFNMVEESIADSTRWIVFEPNDRTLWKSIRRDITAFLTRLWRDGALMGRTPEEAFFVKCDEETNPPDVVDAGMVVTLIGIAPVKPAEFIVFRISQYAGGTETAVQGGI